MKTVAEIRLNNLRVLIRHEGTIAGVARKADTPPNYLSQILQRVESRTGKARDIGDKLARKLELGYGKRPGWMDTPQTALELGGPGPRVEVKETCCDYAVDRRGWVPLRGWPDVAQLELAHPPDGEWLSCPGEHSAQTVALRVAGDSMWPDYRDGEIIYVDPTLIARHGDDVVVALADGKYAFKRLQRTPDGQFLESVNIAYPERITRMADDSPIFGVVIGSWMKRRL